MPTPGDYQFRALSEGIAPQRFWHHSKQLTIARYLPPREGQLLVDAGCGSGVIAGFLAKTGAEVVGIDANDAAVAFAARTFGGDRVRFARALADQPLDLPRPADAIYCLELIEHMYRDQGLRMLRGFHGQLAPDGRLYLTTPNGRSAWPAIERVMDLLGLAPRMQGNQHVERYSRRSLAPLVERAGFTIERMATTCGLAPWIAGLNWSLAERVHAMEGRLPTGCILVCVARKRPA